MRSTKIFARTISGESIIPKDAGQKPGYQRRKTIYLYYSKSKHAQTEFGREALSEGGKKGMVEHKLLERDAYAGLLSTHLSI